MGTNIYVAFSVYFNKKPLALVDMLRSEKNKASFYEIK